MTPERARAYRRVMQTLYELGPTKLLGDEQQRLRDAADSLIFSQLLADDPAARDALSDVDRLCVALVESGRWEQATAMRLAHDVSGCGPPPPEELEAA
jgi:alpha-D-ribose 1-methylphosphonate 5-triphosphate synthase subunit PhnL